MASNATFLSHGQNGSGPHRFVADPPSNNNIFSALQNDGLRTSRPEDPFDSGKGEQDFHGLIGSSSSMRIVLEQIRRVAPTNATVLIEGETGTGKEMIAQAIHDLSPRRGAAFQKVNCAAIPRELLESDLFGHERGAFTGAIAQKLGRFDLAHNGTLFLDEVGDMPLELQPKLLRVLQEHEFERLGSAQTRRVDVRLVAATNCGIEELVQENRFRSDLFYRLSVFPVRLPPLRERRGDIPALARYFVGLYAKRMGKGIDRISEETLDALVKHDWPGNVRELQNFIERAVILSPGPALRAPLGALQRSTRAFPSAGMTLKEAQRDHIVKALEERNWVVGGKSGAAVLLGVKRTTLLHKMQRLGVSRQAHRAVFL